LFRKNIFDCSPSSFYLQESRFLLISRLDPSKRDMSLLIKNIMKLVQVEYDPKRWIAGSNMAEMHTIDDAYIIIEGETITSFGEMKDISRDLEKQGSDWHKVIDASGRMVFPCWCDSHTHLVFPASREIEYIDKIKGLSYEEIARRGGGILNSARKLHETAEKALFLAAAERIEEIISFGTGAVEIKSGYGLTVQDELKMLRVIRRLKETSPVTIISTFLGAHAIPMEYKANPAEYVNTKQIPQNMSTWSSMK
jgi:imidazolonepropionase